MENKLAVHAPPFPEPASSARPAAQPAPPAAPEVETGPDLRLVIEETAGTFVYKTIDRRTGEIVQQLPREEVVRMREEQAYAAGHVVSAKA